MRKLPKILTDEEIKRLYQHFHKNRRNKTNARDLAMTVLMLEYGLRISEVTSLERDALNMISGRMQVTGKGKKDRVLYVQPSHLKIIREWLDVKPESKWLFCVLFNSRGTPGKNIDPRQFREKLYRIGRKTNIATLHPHQLRHTFATKLYTYTKDLAMVQDILGHENITTTRIYTHISGADVKDTLKDFHNNR